MTPIRTDGLTKEFRLGLGRQRVVALDRLNLEVHQGEIFGFLGHNGAGKTTTIKLLLGLLAPTAGQAWILDRPIEDVTIKQQVGFLPEAPYFYEYLTAEEFLTFYGQLFGLGGAPLTKKVEELLEMVALTDARRLQLRKFSKGMLQRIGLAQALINDPALVVLDEPMSGLDPIGRRDVRDIILSLKEEGKTVFFSTHILPDVEMICDRVGILVRGRLRAVGTVQDLVGTSGVASVEMVVAGLTDAGIQEAERQGGKVLRRGAQVLLRLDDPSRVDSLVELVLRSGGRLVSLVPHKRTLEDLFLEQVKAGL
ncbi:MAG: ABC transporter ATP-binding protein [Nitrospirae bacterium]|nr:MAG: ABC transporter ATP-binding protein [Nitrospirota bacterium]TLY46151.1 MAG: ABC transporter ATP-binding protein [Nitrospirota bacterium]